MPADEFLSCGVIVKYVVEAEWAGLLVCDPVLEALVVYDVPAGEEPSLDHLVSAYDAGIVRVGEVREVDEGALDVEHCENLLVARVRREALLEVPVVGEDCEEHEQEELAVVGEVGEVARAVDQEDERRDQLCVQEGHPVVVPLARVLDVVDDAEDYLCKERDDVDAEGREAEQQERADAEALCVEELVHVVREGDAGGEEDDEEEAQLGDGAEVAADLAGVRALALGDGLDALLGLPDVDEDEGVDGEEEEYLERERAQDEEDGDEVGAEARHDGLGLAHVDVAVEEDGAEDGGEDKDVAEQEVEREEREDLVQNHVQRGPVEAVVNQVGVGKRAQPTYVA